MKKKIIIGAALVLVIAAVVTVNVLQSKKGVGVFGGGKVEEVSTEKVTMQDISSTISASGIIEEVEKKEIYFETPLKVKKLFVKKDDKVTKGQKLVEFDMDNIISEFEQLKVSKTIQELAIKKVRESDGTKSIAALEVAVEQALSAIQADERGLADAQRDYDRNKILFEGKAISQTEFDRYDKALKDMATKLDNSKLTYQTAKSNLDEVKRTNSQLNNQKSIDLDNQEQQLKLTLLKIADMERRIARIEESSVSPFNGVVTEVAPVEGATVSTVQPSFKIIDNTRLQVKADVKEFDIKKVKIGQRVNITGDAIDEKDGVTGTVKSISSVAKKNKTVSGDDTLVEITVSVDKVIPVLKPGLSVTCKVVTDVRKNVPVATFMMLRDDKDGNKSIFVVKDNIINERKVTLGINSELSVEITDGLSEGDEVVINPRPNLKDGSRAKVTGTGK